MFPDAIVSLESPLQLDSDDLTVEGSDPLTNSDALRVHMVLVFVTVENQFNTQTVLIRILVDNRHKRMCQH